MLGFKWRFSLGELHQWDQLYVNGGNLVKSHVILVTVISPCDEKNTYTVTSIVNEGFLLDASSKSAHSCTHRHQGAFKREEEGRQRFFYDGR